jgi:hypothetical protein
VSSSTAIHCRHDAARALPAKGITGKLTFVDANTGKSRTIIDIEEAAKLTMSEESRDGLRIRKYRESPDSRAPAPDDDICPPHHAPRGERGCLSLPRHLKAGLTREPSKDAHWQPKTRVEGA